MLSRALITATVTVLIGGFAAIPVRAENLEAGKSPSQIFSGTCLACHKGMRGLIRTVAPGSLPGFLRQHYTTSAEMAGQLSAYLLSNGAVDTRAGGGLTRQGKDAKSEPKPAVAPEPPEPRLGHRQRPAAPQEAERPDSDGQTVRGEAAAHQSRNARRLARPGADEADKPAPEGRPAAAAASDTGPSGRPLSARHKRGRPGREEPPKSDAAKSEPDRDSSSKGEAEKTETPKDVPTRDEAAKAEAAKATDEAKAEAAKAEAAKAEAVKAEGIRLLRDPVGPKPSEGEAKPAPAPTASIGSGPSPSGKASEPSTAAAPAAKPGAESSAPAAEPGTAAAPPAPPISQ